MSINKVLREYYDSHESVHVRLGQWFVNHYIEGVWPELFYEENDRESVNKIYIWLLDNGYSSRIPKKISK